MFKSCHSFVEMILIDDIEEKTSETDVFVVFDQRKGVLDAKPYSEMSTQEILHPLAANSQVPKPATALKRLRENIMDLDLTDQPPKKKTIIEKDDDEEIVCLQNASSSSNSGVLENVVAKSMNQIQNIPFNSSLSSVNSFAPMTTLNPGIPQMTTTLNPSILTTTTTLNPFMPINSASTTTNPPSSSAAINPTNSTPSKSTSSPTPNPTSSSPINPPSSTATNPTSSKSTNLLTVAANASTSASTTSNPGSSTEQPRITCSCGGACKRGCKCKDNGLTCCADCSCKKSKCQNQD